MFSTPRNVIGILLVLATVAPGGSQAARKTIKTSKMQVLKDAEISRVQILTEYRLGDAPVSVGPGRSIVVVETTKNVAPEKFARIRPAICRFEYSFSRAKTESAPGVAVGMQMKLVSGELFQLWIVAKSIQPSRIQTESTIEDVAVDGTVLTKAVTDAQSISGLTFVGSVPNGVTRFNLVVDDLELRSGELVPTGGNTPEGHGNVPDRQVAPTAEGTLGTPPAIPGNGTGVEESVKTAIKVTTTKIPDFGCDEQVFVEVLWAARRIRVDLTVSS